MAAEIAVALNADKLIMFEEHGYVRDANGRNVTNLTPAQLDELLDHTHPANVNQLRAMLRACRAGLPRGHLVSFAEDGAVLQELFTAQGHGTQISEHVARGVRPARLEDVAGIVELIRPLEESGVLVRRDRDRLEQEIDNFLVAELDGIVVGCCALYPFDGAGEIACVAVHDAYRRSSTRPGIGAGLLRAAEERARGAAMDRLFLLTTQARDWFLEQGFVDGHIDDLPGPKQALYNYQRNSKVMIKALGPSDDR
jgi:amino-acid N-acetyltransferase